MSDIDPLKQFQQNLCIEKQLGNQWGYQLDNTAYMQIRAMRLKKQGLRINQSITPLQTKQKPQQQNRRLMELSDEIEQMEMKKKMQTKRYEEGKELNVRQLMNQRIREYNYIIDHKQFSRTTPKFIQSKSCNIQQQNDLKQLKQVLSKIRSKQQQLCRPGNLLGKFNSNKQINKMYRQYAQSMNIHNKKPIKYTKLKYRDKSSYSMTEMKTPTLSKIKDKQKQKMGSLNLFKLEEPVNVQYPYVSQNFIKRSEEINEQIKRNKYIGELMREKINKIQSTFSTPQNKKLNKSILDERQSQTQRSDFQIKLKILTQHRRRSNAKKIRTGRTTQQQKKNCLASAMKKISPQYIKAEGSKIIKKFDYNQIAKEMLQGQQKQQKQVKINQIQLRSISKTSKNANMNSISTDHIDNADQTNAMLFTFIKEAVDDDYYQTTCRNQKMNLLMKSRRNH